MIDQEMVAWAWRAGWRRYGQQLGLQAMDGTGRQGFAMKVRDLIKKAGPAGPHNSEGSAPHNQGENEDGKRIQELADRS